MTSAPHAALPIQYGGRRGRDYFRADFFAPVFLADFFAPVLLAAFLGAAFFLPTSFLTPYPAAATPAAIPAATAVFFLFLLTFFATFFASFFAAFLIVLFMLPHSLSCREALVR